MGAEVKEFLATVALVGLILAAAYVETSFPI
jgi:hypothetical protein